MSFKFRKNQFLVLCTSVFSTAMVNAAEWKTEPSLFLKTQYNDNVRMRADNNNPESSTGFTLEPRVKFAGEEQYLWDMSVDARGKVTRFQDVEDADSDNAFFVFDGGKQTERSDWRLNTSFDRNSNFDTDFDTENPDAGLLDDHTERKTASVSPSVKWSMSETSQIMFTLNSTDVAFDEVTSNNLQNYDYDSATFNAYWVVQQNHQLGFTGAYSEYDSPEANFSYKQNVLQVDYTYTINEISNVSISLGERKLDSTLTDTTVACEANGFIVPVGDVSTNGECPETAGSIFTGFFPVTPIIEDVSNEDDGIVVNLTYSSKSETTSHSVVAGRKIIPSSFGSAQEERSVTYQFNIKNTERFTTNVIIDASETETVSGVDSSSDRTRYRFEPSLRYKLNRNWDLSLRYRYIEQNISNSDEDSTSNTVFVNLFLHWPKLVTTY